MALSDRMPLGKMLLVYLGTLIAGNAIVIALHYVAPNLPMPDSVGIVFAMVASMSAGGTAATALARPLVAGEKLRFAVAATVASLALTAAFFLGLFAWLGVPLTVPNLVTAITGDAATAEEMTAILPWIGLFAAVVSLFVCFFAVGFGAKSQLRAVERRAAKGK